MKSYLSLLKKVIPFDYILRYSALVCSILLLLSIFILPLAYYITISAIVTWGCLLLIIQKSIYKKYIWMLVFVVIAILYNPYAPIFIIQKSRMFLYDILVALLFLMQYLIPDQKTEQIANPRKYTRDRIY